MNKWFSQICKTNQQIYELPSMVIGHLRWHISRLFQFHCLPLKLNRISRTIITIITDMVFIDSINYYNYQFVCSIRNISLVLPLCTSFDVIKNLPSNTKIIVYSNHSLKPGLRLHGDLQFLLVSKFTQYLVLKSKY